MKRRNAIWLIAFVSLVEALAGKKRYDERGNPLTAETEQTVQQKTDREVGSAGENLTPEKNVPLSAEANRTSSENDRDEEAATTKSLRNPLTQVYFENAQLYLRSGRLEKALEYLRRAQEAGEDSFAREARLQAYYLRARRGDANLANEAESLDEAQRLSVFLRIADGYHACAREQAQKQDCLAEAERMYALLAELAPASNEGKLAALRLALLLLEQNRLEAALPHLTRLLASERNESSNAPRIPYDHAWFMLGSLYERPWYHRDTHKASQAYQQVLRYSLSPYRKEAKERLHYLQRFGTGKTPYLR